MRQKTGIVRFLGTNCDRDVWQAAEAFGLEPEWIWYENGFDPHKYHAVILPGGFSYGDYLRCGALAAKTPVMDSVRRAARLGTPVFGICNGFQVLCEAGLLPGVLVANQTCRFVDRWVELEIVNGSVFGDLLDTDNMSLPIAHAEGCFYAEEDELKKLEDNEQVWMRYKKNPNGSKRDIAGVFNKDKNVGGLMPHPERAVFDWMEGTDGSVFFESLL